MQIFRRIASRRLLLLAVMGIVFVGLTFILFRLEPLYTATAQIVIEAPLGQSTNPLQPSPSGTADREKVASEVQVLLSRGLTDKAIAEFKLSERPEFNAMLDPSYWGLVRVFMGARGRPSEIAERFSSRLSVFPVGTSRVIAVEFTSNDPNLARDVSNRISELYLEGQRQASLDLNARASGWMSDQIEALRKRVAESEAKAEEFRARTGLLEGNGVQLQAQQLSELNTQLSAARAARSDAQARVATLERLTASNVASAGAESDLQVLQSPLIQQIRQQEIQLKREVNEMATVLLPSHPRMIQKQAELDALEVQLRSEIGKVNASVRNEAQVAAAREATAQRELRALEGRRAVADRDQIALRAFEREAAANRSVLESFLSRYTEISTRGDLAIQDTNARIISRAETPEGPSFPKRGPMMVLAAMVSFGFGLGAVFFAEITSGTVRHLADIESVSGVPVLASLPAVIAPGDEILRKAGGAFADGLRSLHAGLGIMPAGKQRGRVVAVTSTARGEGRTTTALGLARSMAQGGLRVLLIDADFTHPDIERAIGKEIPWGFRDLVAGRAGYSQVIVRDPASGAHVISAGHDDPGFVLISPRLRPVMLGLVYAYDAVVMDCEPVSSGDAQFLMRLADQCIYAVRWNATKRDRVVANVRQIAATRGRGRGGLALVVTRASRSQVV